MGRKKRNERNKNEDKKKEALSGRHVSSEAIRGVSAIFLIAVAIFLLLARFEIGGITGAFFYKYLSWLLGVGYFLLPLSLVLLAILIFLSFERHFGVIQMASMFVFLLSGLGMISIGFPGDGGVLGGAVSNYFVAAVDTTATVIFLIAFIIASLVVAFDIHLGVVFADLRERFKSVSDEETMQDVDMADIPVIGIPIEEQSAGMSENPDLESQKGDKEDASKTVLAKILQRNDSLISDGFPIITATGDTYIPPPISILGRNKGKPEVGDVKANMNIIKRTLQNFGIQVEMDEVSIGPTVTRYAMKPAEGVRLSKIVALQSNLELALAASPIRMEAPIPGKSLVGIEVPNISRTTLGLAPLLSEIPFVQSDKPLLVALGRSITGAPHFADLARMPHILVAGTTGAGKTCGKDTYAFSEKGILTFEELCPLPLNSEIDYSLRVATRDGIESTSKNYNNGICEFYKITTDEGLSIEVTAEHPLWVIRSGEMHWQNGGSIQSGEYVAISRGSKLFGSYEDIQFTPIPNKTNKAREIKIPLRMTKELGLFLGLLSADGGLTVHNRIVYTQANEEVLRIYINLLESLFGIAAPAVAKSGQSNKAKDVIVHSKHLKDFLAHLGAKAVGAREKEMPKSIRESGPEIIKAFIRGLIRNDGHISPKRGLEITLANEKFLRQLQITLLNFGIVSNLHSKKVKYYEHNGYWRLTVYGEEFASYAREIGFLTDEEERKARQALNRNRNTNRNIIPTLSSLLNRLSLMYRGAFAKLTNFGWHYQENMLVPKYAFKSLPSYASGVRNPSYVALDRILTFYEPLSDSADYRKIAKIQKDNFYWAKVARIERTTGEGYDFEVPGSNSFVGNGFINHNSVAIHDLIVSLLYRCGPERLRFIMIDPKRVELTLYNSIPHLLTPVITDAKKAILAVKWLSKEMERRYNILEAEAVRDISSYHENVVAVALEKHNKDDSEEPLPEAMPYIVVIIDELADMMSLYPRELESGIVRLAQMSRAVGIHLILSTQRPSVKVITGLIKANIPARVALQVASQIDSRTILDMGGAEKLLGAGDMLFLSGEMSKPRRIQAPFISEKEVKRVVEYVAKTGEGKLPSEIDFTDTKATDVIFSSLNTSEDDGDSLYPEAKQAVLEAGKASTSYLQRKLRVGYARAARLIDLLEERGVIGPGDGAKPREIIGAGNADELASGANGLNKEEEDTERSGSNRV